MRIMRAILATAFAFAITACDDTDGRINDAVKERLARQPDREVVDVATRDREDRLVRIGVDGVEVEVHDGNVRLRGDVPAAGRAAVVNAATEASPEVVRVDD